MAPPIALDDVGRELRGGAVAIGNFDGVHRGHQRVLQGALDAGRPALALTFEPHPRSYFGRDTVFRLTPPDEKADVIAAFGLDATVVATFDGAFARLSADAFIDEILIERLGARVVAVGANFNFGARRQGDVALLRARGAAAGFAVHVVEFAEAAGAVVSSSRVRDNLAAGEVAAANALLGYRYRVTAAVRHGEKRGRTMGFPTINQALEPANGLRHGIYAVRVAIDGAWRDGVASFGRRPTFDDGAPLLETFVFDYEGDLYGRTLPVAFVAFLREERRFDTVEDLVVQMDVDSANARAALADLNPLGPLDAALNF